MSKNISFILICCIALMGCSSKKGLLGFGKQARVVPISIIEVAGQVCKEYTKNQKDYAGDNVKAYFSTLCNTGVATGTDNKLKRDQFTYALLTLADNVCTVELSNLSGGQRGVNAIMSILNTSLSTASTIATGNASTILSGSATVVGASRDHINAEVYRNAIAPTVTKVINEDKAKLRAEIEKKMDEPNGDFSREQGVYLANQYHQKCSFYHGLMLVNEALNNPDKLANQITAAELEVKRLNQQINAIRRANPNGFDDGDTIETEDEKRVAKLSSQIDQLNKFIITSRIPGYSVNGGPPPAGDGTPTPNGDGTPAPDGDGETEDQEQVEEAEQS